MRGEAPCPGRRKPAPSETPPRAWGRHIAAIPFENAGGNTPTCVGKTRGSGSGRCCARKHPHVRGEDSLLFGREGRHIETPPRAWGRPVVLNIPTRPTRNTPTCVGKTAPIPESLLIDWKHPHVRGEDSVNGGTNPRDKETPPRAWGRLPRDQNETGISGNTPTCVGKTRLDPRRQVNTWKHPHVRGEDSDKTFKDGSDQETPPRAWGRLVRAGIRGHQLGNTPTCVGKTTPPSVVKGKSRKHPHVRGEDFGGAVILNDTSETPPRAWGRPLRSLPTRWTIGNTPTCVGKTLAFRQCRHGGEKHPHVRGEDKLLNTKQSAQ